MDSDVPLAGVCGVLPGAPGVTDEQPFVIDDLMAQIDAGIVLNPGAPLDQGLWFLATPYSGTGNLQLAADLAAKQAAFLVAGGVPTFAPIAHGHALYIASRDLAPGRQLGTDAAAWNRINAPIFRACSGVIVCMLAGWRVSSGVRVEVAAAARMGKTVVPMIPGIMPMIVTVNGAKP